MVPGVSKLIIISIIIIVVVVVTAFAVFVIVLAVFVVLVLGQSINQSINPDFEVASGKEHC